MQPGVCLVSRFAFKAMIYVCSWYGSNSDPLGNVLRDPLAKLGTRRIEQASEDRVKQKLAEQAHGGFFNCSL